MKIVLFVIGLTLAAASVLLVGGLIQQHEQLSQMTSFLSAVEVKSVSARPSGKMAVMLRILGPKQVLALTDMASVTTEYDLSKHYLIVRPHPALKPGAKGALLPKPPEVDGHMEYEFVPKS